MGKLLTWIVLLPLLAATPLPAQEAACPEGYIPKPRSARERPRLSRDSRSDVKKVDFGVECVRADSATLDKGVGFGAPLANGMDSYLVAALKLVSDFAGRLPNYICDQTTDRFKSGDRPPRWKKDDRIENELLFVDGREHYRDFRRNGKKLKHHSPISTGTWSTGDWGSALLDAFSENTAAQFEFVREEKLDEIDTRLYDFRVKKENSHWRLTFDTEPLYPAYHGSLWIDDETLVVRRLELIAEDLPITYPKDVVEMTVDFGPVPIAGEDHLVALRSEVLACRRWKTTCTRNTSHYRNYRVFSTESTVMQTESTVTFEAEPKRKEQ